MSDVMLFGVLKMPYEMAMESELSRIQFYQRVQQLVARVEAQQPPPVQEPVGEVVNATDKAFECKFIKILPIGTKLYTTPPQRELVGLTDEEKADLVHELFAPCNKEASAALYLLTAHNNKLKEKNTCQQ